MSNNHSAPPLTPDEDLASGFHRTESGRFSFHGFLNRGTSTRSSNTSHSDLGGTSSGFSVSSRASWASILRHSTERSMIPISDAQSGNDSARSGNDSTRSGNNSGMPEAVAVDQAAKRAIIPWLPEGQSWTLPSDYRLHSRDKPADETINYVFTVLFSQSVALPTGVTFGLVRDLNRPSSAYHKLFEIEGDTQDELLERMSLRWVNAKTFSI